MFFLSEKMRKAEKSKWGMFKNFGKAVIAVEAGQFMDTGPGRSIEDYLNFPHLFPHEMTNGLASKSHNLIF